MAHIRFGLSAASSAMAQVGVGQEVQAPETAKSLLPAPCPRHRATPSESTVAQPRTYRDIYTFEAVRDAVHP